MLLFVAGVAGFATLILEVLGVHWLAPWFGTSALVWANQIGIVLAAMALGGWAGALQTRRVLDSASSAGHLLSLAGGLILLSVWVLPYLFVWVLPEDLRLDEAARIFFQGSLTASLLFLAPPVFLLAMISPLLVEARAKERSPGQAAGELAACGTLGSLLGVFGGSFFAIPIVGVRETLLFTAILLLLVGSWLTRSRRGLPISAVALLLFFIPSPSFTAHLPKDAIVLAVEDTLYQRLRVIEFPDGERWLQMNEGLDSYQSRWNPGSPWPGGYYDLFALAPLLAETGNKAIQGWILGHGAGSSMYPLSKALEGKDWQVTGIEIDPAIETLAADYFPLPDSIRKHESVLYGLDARAALRSAPANLDFILLDVYSNQFEIPTHMASEEFFEEVFNHLREGGVLAMNLPAHLESIPDFSNEILSTVHRVFQGNTKAHLVPMSRNAVVFARKKSALPALGEYLSELVGFPSEIGAALLEGQTLSVLPFNTARYRDNRSPLSLDQNRFWISQE